MLKYKRVNATELVAGEERLFDMIAGMAGKARKIVLIGTEYQATAPTDYLRVYRDAEQICDIDLTLLNTENRMLPMDLPLAEGQQCKVGVYGVGLGVSPDNHLEITIGYEET